MPKDYTKYDVIIKIDESNDEKYKGLSKSKLPEIVISKLLELNKLEKGDLQKFSSNEFKRVWFPGFPDLTDNPQLGENIRSKYNKVKIHNKMYYVINQWELESIELFISYIKDRFSEFVQIDSCSKGEHIRMSAKGDRHESSQGNYLIDELKGIYEICVKNDYAAVNDKVLDLISWVKNKEIVTILNSSEIDNAEENNPIASFHVEPLQYEEAFKGYLRKKVGDERIYPIVQGCRRVAMYEGCLKMHYERDLMANVLQRLHPAHPNHSVPINGNSYNGTSNLKHSVKHYQEFLKHKNIDINNETRQPVQIPLIQQNVLPIFLEPNNATAFKRLLLHSKRAEIKTKFTDGREEVKPWDARNFKANSNVIGNLRSRPEFRKGAWQMNGIDSVHVKAIN